MRHQPIYLGETPLSGIMGQDLGIPQNLALLSDVGITHAEVGRVLGVSKYTVRGWQRGDRPPAAELTGLVLRAWWRWCMTVGRYRQAAHPGNRNS